jgi:succinate dehydrogenase/fumarate reductase cytochrome b subunit
MQALMGNWIFQLVFLVFGLFHAINGLRITLMDLQPKWIEHFTMALNIEFAIYALLCGYAIFVILRTAFRG